jgi:hypothetical protein
MVSGDAMFISYREREYLDDGAMRYRQRIPALIRWINLMSLLTVQFAAVTLGSAMGRTRSHLQE